MSNIKRMIRRVDVTEVLREMLIVSKDESEKECIVRVWEQIKGIPVEDIAPVVHGHWAGKPLAGYSTVKCSACGSAFVENNGKWKHCPDCGAKMDVTDINVGNKEKVTENG